VTPEQGRSEGGDPVGDAAAVHAAWDTGRLVVEAGPREPQDGGRPPARRGAVARAMGLYALTLLAVVTFVFALPRAMPGDPLSALDDPAAGVFISDPQVRERALAYYGLDRPLPQQYVTYVTSVARGDLGWSIARNTPVSTLIAAHLPWTLLLMGTAMLLSSGISWFAGVAAAWRRGALADRVVLVTLTGVRGIPDYALAAIFLVTFAVLLPVFPLYGARTPFAQHPSVWHSLWDIVAHLILPVSALTLSLIGSKFLLLRNTMLSALGEDYMLLARAKGLPRRLLKYRHAGRNALLPFLTVLGIQAGFAVGGSIFVEAVFAYPGMGTLILRAVDSRDYPVLEAAFLVLATTVLVANLLIEIAYTRLDPRVGAE
jgi:peptide/nickel transport system permease protein